MSLLAAAPSPFLAEAWLCCPELGALLPWLFQDLEPVPFTRTTWLHPGTCPQALCAGLGEEEPWGWGRSF